MQFSLWPNGTVHGAGICGPLRTVGTLQAQNSLKVLDSMGIIIHILFSLNNKQSQTTNVNMYY